MSKMWGFILGIGLAPWLFLLVPAQAAIIYVDNGASCPGSGASGSPYCSIQNAFNVVNPGDSINIRTGTGIYDQRALLTRSGTSGNPITIQPDTGANFIIRYTGNGSDNGAIQLGNVSHVTVQNLTLDGTGVFTSRFGIWLDSRSTTATGVKILNNSVKNWGGNAAQAQTLRDASSGIRLEGNYGQGGANGPNGALVQGNVLDAIRTTSIALIGKLNNSTIENNEIKNQKCGMDIGPIRANVGIRHVDGSTDGTLSLNNIIRGNNIHDFQSRNNCDVSSVGGYETWTGYWCDVGPSLSELSGNRVYNIDQGNASDGTSASIGLFVEAYCRGWNVFNNVIANVGVHGIRQRMENTSLTQNVYTNNTIYNTGITGFDIADGPLTIKNNVVMNAGTAQIYFDTASGTGARVIDYNLYWDSAGGNKVGRGGGSVLNFANWKSTCNCDQNSLNANPQFVNTGGGDFHLQPTSPALDAGEGGVDMGAYPDNSSGGLSAPVNLRIIGQ